MNGKLTPWTLFEDACERYGDRTLLVYNERSYTYAQIREQAEAFARLAGALDYRMAGVYLPNCAEFITCMLGLSRERKAFVSLSYQFKGEALIELLDYADIELLITDAKGIGAIEGHAGRLNVRFALVLGNDGSFEIRAYPGKPVRPLPGIGENTFGICFTSGSTSRPKGIVLSNDAIVGNALAVAAHLNFTCEDRTIVPRSLAQASPLAGDVLMAISRGGGIILLNNVFHPAIFLKAIQDYEATQFYIVRTMLLQTLEYPGFAKYDLSSLKRVLIGGMVNSLNVYQEAAKRLPRAKVYNAYGTSEAVARVTFGEHEDVTTKACVIGKPIPGCSVSVLREDGTEAETGETGEIYIRSAYAMDGYYKSEELTAEALTPWGIRVKDAGYRDGDGLFYVLSRTDDMITQGGSRAYPVDIEEVLLKHPAVQETVVLGVEDDKLGQRIVAFATARPGFVLEARELYKWCVSSLEDRKVPKEIHVVDAIPRNVIGKINKNEVKELYRNLLSKEEAAG
ncbi:class I adenylate-forming enzyme family protein [Cohnella suwonensis]|uniref:Class I adenylate-forming enzyme family protein n=1 Tax=Cohnella suwonensis TaxID=696072 RepID=A0ABW0LU48_9BACL